MRATSNRSVGAGDTACGETTITRREFVKTLAATSVAAGLGGLAAWAQETRRGEMIYRTLGRTGEKVSAIGLGGYHIGVPKEEAETIRLIRTAIDRGINFLDNCWSYHNGGSETRMGKALRDGYRDKVFLMTKIEGRTRAAAARQIDDCLQRLQTDRVDLMQYHEVIRLEDADRIFDENGAHEAMVEAQKAGKIRYIGFTGHKDPVVHLRALEVAAQHGVRFDAVQMPLNVMDAHFRSFEKHVLPVLVREGIGVLAMKPLGAGAIVRSGVVSAIECLHYALNLPASVVITGFETMERLEQALEAARTFKPMSAEQVSALLKRTEALAKTGRYERFKTSAAFDATARHPEWLG
ncbi:MAG: aldo/keto reductase [Verrucomicrobiales bacterium]|nr:aldo/keto reductase [Verrucomicrobiales bacterium]